MKKLQEIIGDYLSDRIVKTQMEAGPPKKPEPELVEKVLNSRLEKNSKFNEKIITILIVLLVATFVLICVLIFIFIKNLTVVMTLLGSEGIGIVFIVKRIHTLYKEKVFADYILYLLTQVTSESERKKIMGLLLDFTRKPGQS